jgi:purine-binding chemotaxis protein CheW
MSNDNTDLNLNEYVTAYVGGQLFGLPIRRVQDVFIPDRLTRVPLAPPEIAGVLNLRGRIVTLINLGFRLGLERRDNGAPAMAIGVEFRGEHYGLLIDSVGEVMKLDGALLERNPINLDPKLAGVSTGVFRLDGQLLLVIDVDRILDISTSAVAA